jgi:hypothetical protein
MYSLTYVDIRVQLALHLVGDEIGREKEVEFAVWCKGRHFRRIFKESSR